MAEAPGVADVPLVQIADLPERFDFPGAEEEVIQLWRRVDAFHTSLKRTEGKPEFTFYDGPPFATGTPHYGHILAGTIKDVVTRYATQTGHHVVRRFGWDCHGLPVEFEIDKKLGIKSRDDVFAMGIDKYNQECRSIVMRCAEQWEQVVERVGRWIDFRNDYKTMDANFMETVWWVFKQLFDKGMVYRGFKVMPFSTACSTPLSNFEAKQNYHDDARDPEVYVAFTAADDDNVCYVAWTTTPWTLPSNLALCVNPEFVYIHLKDETPGKTNAKTYVILESKEKDLVKRFKITKHTILSKTRGADLKGRKYKPLFPYFASEASAFRVIADGYVGSDTGTGIVHCAPAHGEDDYRVCVAAGIVSKDEKIPCPVNDSGLFTAEVTDFAGQYVKSADQGIIDMLKAQGRVLASGTIVHSYPFCWRSETPLINKAVPSWFIRVEDKEIKTPLLKHNLETKWVPESVKEKRFHNWLQDARDWAVSRNRFWGTPMPLWVSDDGEEVVCVGSREELTALSGQSPHDLHREFIDHITIPSRTGRGVLRRIGEVFDCWFESGSMPYAQLHYPFENKDFFAKGFPADFIAEGIDQTRGWFYTLMVIGNALFDTAPFKNLIVNGLVLTADGKKMSKRLKNYPDPLEVVNETGADALRLYLIDSPVVKGENLKFKLAEVREVVKAVLLPWYNAFRFATQNYRVLVKRSGKPFVANFSVRPTNVMDRWILALQQSLISFVRAEMAAYRLDTVVPKLLGFINQLTNWYVRLNRPRIKGDYGEDEARASLNTLFEVLFNLARAMAPFTPFFTEYMYQKMKPVLPKEFQDDSVHYLSFPEPRMDVVDPQAEQMVARMQTVVELVRNMRDAKNVSLKMPLRVMKVVHADPAFLADLRVLERCINDETNVKVVEFTAEDHLYATLRAEPDQRALGKRLGKLFNAQLKDEIAALSHETLQKVMKGAELRIRDIVLAPGEFRLLRVARADLPAHFDNRHNAEHDVMVLLDTTVTPDMVEEFHARDIATRVQRMRKRAGLSKEDVIEVFYEDPSGQLGPLITRNSALICNTIKSRLVPKSFFPATAHVLRSSTEDIAGKSLVLSVCRAAVHMPLDSPAAVAAAAALPEKERSQWLAVLQTLVADASFPALQRKHAGNTGSLHYVLDGVKVVLQFGSDVFLSVEDALVARKQLS